MHVKFGTDGARGPYGSDVTPETAYRIGAAGAECMQGTWVMVQDTRTFNDELKDAFLEGLTSRHARAIDLGVMPTPAAALVASQLQTQSGLNHNAVSFSASHNPYTDAGIKIFGNGGRKLNDDETLRIQNVANNIDLRSRVRYKAELADRYVTDSYRNSYIEMILSSVDQDLRWDKFLTDRKIVIDAANGAAYETAPEVIRRLGGLPILINGDPNRHINENCGAEHPKSMITAVEASDEIFYGMSLDGDADRLIAYTKSWRRGKGRILDGDDSLALAAQDLISRGHEKRTAVVTAYTSLGFEKFMDSIGFELIEVENGDRYILEEFGLSWPDSAQPYNGHPIGGEQSGHTLYPLVASAMNRVISGDGTLTALQQLQTEVRLDKTLDNLSEWEKLAYIKDSVKLPKGVDGEKFMQRPRIVEVIGRVGSQIDGRLHVRPSGTGSGIRVLTKTVKQSEADEAHAEVMRVIREEAA